MKIGIFAHKLSHAVPYLAAFANGLDRHGQRFEFYGLHDHADVDLAVFWSHKRHDLIKRQQQRGRRYLVLERGYIGDRKEWTSLGFDGLNGRADFGTDQPHVDGSRWKRYFPDWLSPWRCGSGYDLVIGQVPGDASLEQVDYRGWLSSVAEALNGLDVVFRPHPLYPQQATPRGMKRSHRKSLEADLCDARRCITCNSNTGVDALLAGVPTVTMDRGAMAWPITIHELTPLPPRSPRLAWCHRMAWCQWRIEEMANGDAWQHLRGIVDREPAAA